MHVKVIAQAGPKPHARLKKVVEQGDLLIVFYRLLLAIARKTKRAMTDKNRHTSWTKLIHRTPD